jgi:hypothetical protein
MVGGRRARRHLSPKSNPLSRPPVAVGCQIHFHVEAPVTTPVPKRPLLAEPRHRSIEMMQIKPRDADDGVILAPAIRGAVGAAHEQPVQHGEEHGAFQRKAVLALARQRRDRRPAAGLLPQAGS